MTAKMTTSGLRSHVIITKIVRQRIPPIRMIWTCSVVWIIIVYMWQPNWHYSMAMVHIVGFFKREREKERKRVKKGSKTFITPQRERGKLRTNIRHKRLTCACRCLVHILDGKWNVAQHTHSLCAVYWESVRDTQIKLRHKWWQKQRPISFAIRTPKSYKGAHKGRTIRTVVQLSHFAVQ